MPHVLARTVLRLKFSAGPLSGSTIRVKTVSIGEYLRLKRLQAAAVDGGVKELTESLEAQLDGLAAALVDWDLVEEDGTPIPCTRAGLDGLDSAHAVRIAAWWLETLGDVPDADPLADGSPSGGPSPEVSIPMVPLSPALTS